MEKTIIQSDFGFKVRDRNNDHDRSFKPTPMAGRSFLKSISSGEDLKSSALRRINQAKRNGLNVTEMIGNSELARVQEKKR